MSDDPLFTAGRKALPKPLVLLGALALALLAMWFWFAARLDWRPVGMICGLALIGARFYGTGNNRDRVLTSREREWLSWTGADTAGGVWSFACWIGLATVLVMIGVLQGMKALNAGPALRHALGPLNAGQVTVLAYSASIAIVLGGWWLIGRWRGGADL
jgi:hypothetical protein